MDGKKMETDPGNSDGEQAIGTNIDQTKSGSSMWGKDFSFHLQEPSTLAQPKKNKNQGNNREIENEPKIFSQDSDGPKRNRLLHKREVNNTPKKDLRLGV
uniref:Uncharacterized protein n=1 Tax=Arundo donax TaxID=35708 RepID=A0A0A9NBQ3_ARUDO